MKTPQKQLTGCDRDRGAHKNVGLLNTLSHFPSGAKPCVRSRDTAVIASSRCWSFADRTRGTGRFNLASGALATAVGAGAALSNTYGGYLIHLSGFRVSFLGLEAVALVAFLMLFFFLPETEPGQEPASAPLDAALGETPA
jgi:hypothetical protein